MRLPSKSRLEVDLVHIRKHLIKNFNLSDIKNICFDISIDYDNLAGENTKTDKCRELVNHCIRNGTLLDLLTKLTEERSNVDWYQPKAQYPPKSDSTIQSPEPIAEMHELVRQFNRSRSITSRDERVKIAGSIVVQMRLLAPELGYNFDPSPWLRSTNPGKRLAAIIYANWIQDIEYLDVLFETLFTEQSAFIQYNILSSIYSMTDQIGPNDREKYVAKIQSYQSDKPNDRSFWRSRILRKLSTEPVPETEHHRRR